MSSASAIKENFGNCVSLTASTHITDFRENSETYNLFKEQIQKIMDDLKIPADRAEEINNALMAQLSVEGEFMYNRGIQDGITIVGYLDSEYVNNIMFGLTTEFDPEEAVE